MEREAEQQRETEVGEYLRAHRLHSGLTISEASHTLCIRETYLRAIEDGRFGDLPGPTYVVGFIRTYSEYLGLDGSEVVRRLKAEPLNMDGGSELRFPSPTSEGGMPTGAILLVGIVIALVAYGAWYVSSTRDENVAELISPLPERLVAFLRGGTPTAGQMQTDQDPVSPPDEAAPSPAPEIVDRRESAPQVEPGDGSRAVVAPHIGQNARIAADETHSEPAAETTAEVRDPAADAESETSPATPVASVDPVDPDLPPSTSDEDPSAPAAAMSPLNTRIVLQATDESWVEIRDGNTNRLVVAKLFKPGEAFDVPNIPGLKLLTGNAGGLEILVDGEPVPRLGRDGMVRRNVPLDAEQLRSGALARN